MHEKQENRCSDGEADGDAVQGYQDHKHSVVHALQVENQDIVAPRCHFKLDY